MALQKYGVLKCKAIASKMEFGDDTPHYQIHALAGDQHFRLAVNVRSQERSSPDLLFYLDDNFHHPLTARLDDLPEDYSELPHTPGGSALDYIRGNLFDHTLMRTLPANLPGANNDLNDTLDVYIRRAINEHDAYLYCFGQRWDPAHPHDVDKVFGLQPDQGMHDTHMNQGSSGQFASTDGVWQDGGLLINFPSSRQWVAAFMAFQSQAWHTDDTTGHAISKADTSGVDLVVRIVGALVNPVGPAPEHETVTLLNASPNPVDLGGWRIADAMKNKHPLAGTIAAGASLTIAVAPPVQLGNKGGIITLLDAKGLKVDGVSYTGTQAAREGWTIVF